jgi:hypothetical protein
MEAWYATVSDPGTGSGCWVHHEVVSPLSGDPYVHGWAAVFSKDSPPALERFGPEPYEPAESLPSCSGAHLEARRLTGKAGRVWWDISLEQGPSEDGDRTGPSGALWTFPQWAWKREALPAAQNVAIASAGCTGSFAVEGRSTELSPAARGGLAHIYGHGSAERWGWLHAELGGGDVLEVVSAVSRRPGLDRLPPLGFVQLRLSGRDWPRDPLVAAPLFRTKLGLPEWSISGTVGRWRLRAEITIPEDRSVALRYEDPDGATATCTNSEIADAVILLEHRRSPSAPAGSWETAAKWELAGTAHAEIGTRP